MRYVNMILCVLMALFAVVQYNDPDGPLWMVIYLIPAMWAGIAAWRIDWLTTLAGRAALIICTLGSMALVVYYWPQMADFWNSDVWWVEETAREGMGAMVAMIVMFVVAFSAVRGARSRSQTAAVS